ncbi:MULTISPECIES: GtrA family protein [Heyndrickxia]|uniref:GtrA family protein n=1 Tax=Heyndrickxia TaxID=2837504 RepID=UPI001B1D8587|nr:GtrA family protein [Heyndrickxia oleronia]GIN40504.1 hypothetical protein J19TS1_34530 [Heyndrickxia oleronia]
MSSIVQALEIYLKRTNSFIRFLLVGMINTLIGLFIMFTLLNGFHQPYWLSTFIGNGTGACVSYFLNRVFTFQSRVELNKSVILFIVTILVCYYLSYSLSHLIVYNLLSTLIKGFYLSDEEQAILIGTGFYTIMNYLGQKYIVFKN